MISVANGPIPGRQTGASPSKNHATTFIRLVSLPSSRVAGMACKVCRHLQTFVGDQALDPCALRPGRRERNGRAAFSHCKADAPAIIAPDAVLSPSVTGHSLEAIARQNAQIVENGRPVKLGSPAQRRVLAAHPATNAPTGEERLRILALEALDGRGASSRRDEGQHRPLTGSAGRPVPRASRAANRTSFRLKVHLPAGW